MENQNTGLPPFTLYGLVGCPHCEAAEKFFKSRGIPCLMMFASGDPIIEAGVKHVLNTPNPTYPILVDRTGTSKNGKISIVHGFKKEVYERLAEVLYSVVSADTPSIFSSRQQPIKTVPVEVVETADSGVQTEIIETGEEGTPNPTTKTGKSKVPRVS